VLDLGSGRGIEVLLSVRRATGKAYGFNMTDDPLALAEENQQKAGVPDVEFLKGEIENILLPDKSEDVLNCVISLSANKDRVLHEAFRVLKPGGRVVVSEVVRRGEICRNPKPRTALDCVAGALEEDQYRNKLIKSRGFRRRSTSSPLESPAPQTPETSWPTKASRPTPARLR
jgi:ubiquinone/menaquinone biosynthesis C-methylase UbiE